MGKTDMAHSPGDRQNGGWYDPHDAVSIGHGDYAKYPPGDRVSGPRPALPYGWICTRCGVSHAPYVSRCNCRPERPVTRKTGGKA